MKTSLVRTVVCFAGLVAFPLAASASLMSVSGQANIFGAGHTSAPGANGSGILPPMFTFSGPQVFNFSVTGTVTYNGGGNFWGGDGGQFGPTDIISIGGISGITHGTHRMFLIGVFLNDQEPTGVAPIRLDFTNDGFTDLSPALKQTFFVGDGLTGTGIGSVQSFVAPSGATRLFLGFADGFDFQGLPDFYADNGGALQVNLTATPVPEPGTALVGVLLLGVATARRRRARQ